MIEKKRRRMGFLQTLREHVMRTPYFASTLLAWQGEWKRSAISSLAGITPEVIEKKRRGKDFVRTLHEYIMRTPYFASLTFPAWQGRRQRSAMMSLAGITPEIIENMGTTMNAECV